MCPIETSGNQRTVKLLVIFIIPSMVSVMALTLGAGAFMVLLSEEVAQANPDIAFMRLAVLLIAEAVLLFFFVACALSIPLLSRVYKSRIYGGNSSQLLRWMGLSFFAMIPLLIGLLFYTKAHVAGAITNLYCLLGAGIAFAAGCILFLFAHLIAQGADYKQEVDLTV